MADIKLAKLPDRTPVKLNVTVTPDLANALAAYALLYGRLYDSEVAVVDLIPAMLESFLESDRAFKKAQRE